MTDQEHLARLKTLVDERLTLCWPDDRESIAWAVAAVERKGRKLFCASMRVLELQKRVDTQEEQIKRLRESVAHLLDLIESWGLTEKVKENEC